MKELKTILYATDFSKSSVPACDHALFLARLAGAHLHVLHVISELTANQRSLMPAEAYAALEREVERQAVQEMERFCEQKFDAEIDYETETVIGAPVPEILGKAEDISAGLIVLGTHGRTGLGHAVVGSTAERVVRQATIPVLTVRAQP